ACDKGPPAPPPNTKQAAKGLPPLDPNAPAPPAAAPAPRPQPPAATDDGAVIEGTIDIAAALRDKANPGDTIYIVARSVDAQGNVQRMPIAVDRLQVGSWPLAFNLSSAKTMAQSGAFAGTMQLTARLDKDGVATTRNEGDIEGTAKATVPAKGVQIILDT